MSKFWKLIDHMGQAPALAGRRKILLAPLRLSASCPYVCVCVCEREREREREENEVSQLAHLFRDAEMEDCLGDAPSLIGERPSVRPVASHRRLEVCLSPEVNAGHSSCIM
jgi:hypothetical protein